MAEPAVGSDVSIVFFDALRVKIRDEGVVKNKAVYVALGVAADGMKDANGCCSRLLGNERRRLWPRVVA